MSQAYVKAVNLAVIDTTKLIMEVHARPPLWNLHIVSGKETVERLWSEVADALGTRDKDVKAKWKNLKDQFRKEMKKTVEGGSAYVPAWPHYHRLSFLMEILLQSKRITYSSDELTYAGIGIPPEAESKIEFEDSRGEFQSSSVEPRCSPKRRRATEGEEVKEEMDVSSGGNQTAEIHLRRGEDYPKEDFNSKINVNKKIECGSTHSRSEGTAGVHINPKVEFCTRFESHPKSQSNLHQLDPKPWDCYNLDEDYHFFMSLIPHMKRFTPLQKLRIRNRIQQILIEEMTSDSRNNSATSSTEPTN